MNRYYSAFKDDVILEYMQINGFDEDTILDYMCNKRLDDKSPLKHALKDLRCYIEESISYLKANIDYIEAEMEDWVRLFNEIEDEDE